MKIFFEYLKNALAVFGALILQMPSKRFDRINGSDGKGYEVLLGRAAVVTKEVSANSGKVRYSGVDWNARLAASSSAQSLPKNSVVKIASCSGNTLFVLRSQNEEET